MEESNKSELKAELIYGLNDRPPLRETLFAALQHLLAIFVAIITPPLIISRGFEVGCRDDQFLGFHGIVCFRRVHVYTM